MGISLHKIIEISNITSETYLLKLERKEFNFEPGQYVILRLPNEKKGREYSIFSASSDETLDFLIREIPDGEFSVTLRQLPIGTELQVEGPKGFFILNKRSKEGFPIVLIATGTGISPFHSYVKSFPDLNYHVIHGVTTSEEAYGKNSFDHDRHILCTSRQNNGDYFGRLTDYLQQNPVDPKTICYLCGNSGMIDQVRELLDKQGIPIENVRTEVFF